MHIIDLFIEILDLVSKQEFDKAKSKVNALKTISNIPVDIFSEDIVTNDLKNLTDICGSLKDTTAETLRSLKDLKSFQSLCIKICSIGAEITKQEDNQSALIKEIYDWHGTAQDSRDSTDV